MKMKFTLPISLLLLSLLFTRLASAQAPGDYRSAVAIGDWTTAATWETFNGTTWIPATTAPNSTSGLITILSGDSVTLGAAITIDQMVVETGAALAMGGNLSITLVDAARQNSMSSPVFFLNAAPIKSMVSFSMEP